ncbi:trypsin-like serine protease [Nitzschia inconspicua]|uniref:Trypsin-like serine protease n=1 Tax=Nitzschia inconspicua TaxID=303405 RepID=A0A9K3LA46_9STRA|nr:trypsin-like serine protease [Nitzschia inconspicua]
MRQHHLLSAVVSFLSVFRSQVSGKDGLRRKAEVNLELESVSSPKNNVHLAVINRKHPKKEVTDTGIGDARFGALIIGGDVANPLEYPYFTDLGGCGATLIAPRVVLSAAHCEQSGSGMVGYEVRVGARVNGWYHSDGSILATVEKQANHPNFNERTVDFDFMLMLLEESLEIGGDTVIELSDDESDLAPQTKLHVIGMGVTEFGFVAPELKDAEVEAFSQETCEAVYGAPPGGVTESMFCAGLPEGGVDSCQGDSGGPILLKNGLTHTLVGVVSWGVGCAQPGYPGVYANVRVARDWIKQQVCDDWNVNASFCDGDANPTSSPTPEPTPNPTPTPTKEPTQEPTMSPTKNPTSSPTDEPTLQPTAISTSSPTSEPTNQVEIMETLTPTTSYTGSPTTMSNTEEIPTDMPTFLPIGNDIPTSLPESLACPEGKVLLEFDLTTDDFPYETSWQILRMEDGVIVLEGGRYIDRETLYQYQQCVQDSCHMLILFDSWGDGLGADAAFHVKMKGEEMVTTTSFNGTWKNLLFNC